MTDQVIAENKVPNLYEYWKSLTVKEVNIHKFHEAGWLLGDLICSPTTLNFPIIYQMHIVCFKSHLICGLGLPCSKYLVTILGYLGCKLIHLNSNIIAALSLLYMLCECCLGIPPDTSLFWYYYSPTRYDQKLFFGLGLSLWQNRKDEYLKATF
jgi:hypothetical protein